MEVVLGGTAKDREAGEDHAGNIGKTERQDETS
jgi:hypothetical protein